MYIWTKNKKFVLVCKFLAKKTDISTKKFF